MKKLLHLKHWQLFMATYGLLFLMYFLMLVAFLTMRSSETLLYIGVAGLLIIAAIIVFSVTYMWFWTAGSELYKKRPEGMKMNLEFFKLAVVFPFIYIFLVLMGVLLMVGMDVIPSPWLGLLLIPHFFTIFCMFYIFYFIAKILKSVEMNREAHVGDYIGEFFLLWFFIIGMWFIQPKLNAMFSENEEGMEKHLVE